MNVEVVDGRIPPFSYVTHGTMRALCREFKGPQRSSALSVYMALAYAASKSRATGAGGGFEAERPKLAEAAGVSVRTLDAVTKRFELIGLLRVTRRKEGGVNLPNLWMLLEPDPGGGATTAPPSATIALGVAQPLRTTEEEGTAKNPTRTTSVPSPEGRVSQYMSDKLRARWNVDASSSHLKVGRQWPTAARGIMDDHGVTEEQLMRVIDRVIAHHYWSARIKSMPRLRTEFVEVVKDLTGQNGRMNGNGASRAQRKAELSQRSLERAEELRRQGR